MKKVTPGTYQHYKGNLYEVLYIGNHSETLEKMVIYKALYGTQEIWVRPLSMFAETIILDEKEIMRFKKIN